jgi:hypothetical protein
MSPTAAELDMTLLALADATRRAILQRVSQGEARVTEVALPFEQQRTEWNARLDALDRALQARRDQGQSP